MIIRSLHYSGAPKMFLWVARQLAKREIDVIILTWANKNSVKIPEGIRYINVDLQNVSLIHKIIVIHEIIKRESPDISLSFLLDSNIFNIVGCCGLKTKSVVCERNDPYKPGYYKLKILYPIFRFAKGAVFQLPKVCDYYSIIKAPTAIIPNPVPNPQCTDILPISKRSNSFVSLGRLDIFQKRTDLLIDSFSLVLRKYPAYKLEIWGDGPDEMKLKKQVSKLGIENSVIFRGVSENPLHSMSLSKFFVLSSDFEGIPNSLIEAMSIGMPCISTDCRPGGASFLIKNGKNGIIVPKGNADALSKAMIFFIENQAKAQQLGLEAKHIVEVFNEEVISKMWSDYLFKLIN